MRPLLETMHTTLAKAQKQRPKRNDFVTDGRGRSELAWVTFERSTMFDVVNRERSSRGKPPVTLADIERVERMACGHIDYTMKFAFGCEDLVLRT